MQRINIVVHTGTDKTIISYIHNKATGETKYIESVKMPLKIEPFVFKQETNQFGETTTITNQVREIMNVIP